MLVKLVMFVTGQYASFCGAIAAVFFSIHNDVLNPPPGGGWGYLKKFNTGRLHPVVQLLFLLYTILAVNTKKKTFTSVFSISIPPSYRRYLLSVF